MQLQLALATTLIALALPATVRAAPGDPDPAFGVGGETVVAIGAGEPEVLGLALSRDGSIVVAAQNHAYRGGDRSVLVRFTADGRLDRRFGTGGIAAVTGLQLAGAPAIEPDGGMLLGGYVDALDGSEFAVARFDREGTPDPAFGDRGVTVVPFLGQDSWAVGVARDALGRIVAGGTASFAFALARLTRDGSLDPSFGAGGKATTDVSAAGSRAVRMILDGSGRPVLAGSGTYIDADGHTFQQPVIARYTDDGRLDEAFGSAGTLPIPIPHTLSFASDVLVQPDGSLVATVGGTARVPLLRYTTDGSLDGSFGNGGDATIERRALSSGIALARQSNDGKLLVTASDGVPRVAGGWALARVNVDGSPDRSFAHGGVFTTARGPDYWSPRGLGIQPGGGIVVAGTSMGCGSRVLSLIRVRGRAGGPAAPAPAIRGCGPRRSKDGKHVSVIVDCPMVALSCKGSVALRHRSVRIGEGRFDLRGGRRYALVRIGVRRGARPLLEHGKSVRATATYRVKGKSGRARTIVRRVSIER
jgi:uncharacterized delta-60 repeat protein